MVDGVQDFSHIMGRGEAEQSHRPGFRVHRHLSHLSREGSYRGWIHVVDRSSAHDGLSPALRENCPMVALAGLLMDDLSSMQRNGFLGPIQQIGGHPAY